MPTCKKNFMDYQIVHALTISIIYHHCVCCSIQPTPARSGKLGTLGVCVVMHKPEKAWRSFNVDQTKRSVMKSTEYRYQKYKLRSIIENSLYDIPNSELP